MRWDQVWNERFLGSIFYSSCTLIDKIAGSSTNFERYSQLYEEAERLTGTVDIKVQDKSSKIVLDILGSAFRIDSSTSKKLNILLNF